MDKDPSNSTKRQASTSAEASLNAALSDLEQMLEQRQQPSGARRAAKPKETARSRGSPESRRGDDAQYTIPLLHDVVVPGADASAIKPSMDRHASTPRANEAHPDDENDEDELDEACLKVLERLSNEIEVIVQARIEAAVQDAAGRIRVDVRNHLEIVLPEIIDELKHLTRERR